METFLSIMSILIGASGAVSLWFFRRGGIYNPVKPRDFTELDYLPSTASETPEVPKDTISATTTPSEAYTKPQGLLWDTPKDAWHSVRVLCDEEGLSVSEKNLICAVIYQESGFKNTAVCRNKDKQGNILSSDWGICQVNDYWHCGKGKTFPTAEYVVAHPEEAVRWMLKMYRLGLLKLWVGYSSNAYKKHLSPDSKMWALKS